jgi:hypothetical protein
MSRNERLQNTIDAKAILASIIAKAIRRQQSAAELALTPGKVKPKEIEAKEENGQSLS